MKITIPSRWFNFATTGSYYTGSQIITGSLTIYTGSIDTNALVLTPPLSEASGGTNQSTYTKGDLIWSSTTNTLSKLNSGSNGQVIRTSATGLEWTTTGSFGDMATQNSGSVGITGGNISTTNLNNITNLTGTFNPYITGSAYITGSQIITGSLNIFTGSTDSNGLIVTGPTRILGNTYLTGSHIITGSLVISSGSTGGLTVTGGNILLGNDNANSLGTSTNRFATGSFSQATRIYAASGDANPTSSLASGALYFGVGGATASDVSLRRVGTDTIALYKGTSQVAWDGAQFYPNPTGTNLGSSGYPWNKLFILAVQIKQTGTLTVGSLGSLICPVKTTTGEPSDTQGGNLDGAIIVNTGSNTLYMRMGSVWNTPQYLSGSIITTGSLTISTGSNQSYPLILSNGGIAPTSGSAPGTSGAIVWNQDYLYMCTGSAGGWGRIALADW